MHRFFTSSTLIILFSLSGFLYYVFNEVPESQWKELSAENAHMEMATAILFFIAAFLAMINFIKSASKMNFVFMALMALAGARELDLHKEWTTQSILKSRFYLDPTTPGVEKFIGGLVILFLIYAAWLMIKRVPYFIASLWSFVPTAWALGFGFGLLIIAKTLDSMKRILPFLAEFHLENREFLNVVEESFEMTGAIFFVLLALLRLKNR